MRCPFGYTIIARSSGVHGPETFSPDPLKLSLLALWDRITQRHFPKGALARESDLELARAPFLGPCGEIKAQGLGFEGWEFALSKVEST